LTGRDEGQDIDIGTNGELVLGNCEKIISSSCAPGPAFEDTRPASLRTVAVVSVSICRADWGAPDPLCPRVASLT